MQYKLRLVMKDNIRQISVYGITIPGDVAQFFNGVYFECIKNGNDIILKSGCCQAPTKKEIQNYEYQDCSI